METLIKVAFENIDFENIYIPILFSYTFIPGQLETFNQEGIADAICDLSWERSAYSRAMNTHIESQIDNIKKMIFDTENRKPILSY